MRVSHIYFFAYFTIACYAIDRHIFNIHRGIIANTCIKGASCCELIFIILYRDGEVIIQMILTYFNCTNRKLGLGTSSET